MKEQIKSPKEKALDWFKKNDDGEYDSIIKTLDIALKEQSKQHKKDVFKILPDDFSKVMPIHCQRLMETINKW